MPGTTLSEAASKALLAPHGVPVPDERVVATASPTPLRRPPEIGFPVVVKLCGDAIAHKTERGLVRLGLGDARGGAKRPRPSCWRRPRPSDGEVGLLVAPMVRGNRELIAGLGRDPQFGMTVMLGVGGVLAEAIADVVFRLVPIDRDRRRRDDRRPAHPGAARPVPGRAGGRPRRGWRDVLVGLSRRAPKRDPTSCRSTSTR